MSRSAVVLLAVCLPLVAIAGGGRVLFEDGTAGVTSPSSTLSTATLVFGQPATTLVDQACVAGVCTRAAPSDSSDPQEGISLDAASSWRVTVCAAEGETLSGGGLIEAWYYNPYGTPKWTHNPSLDLGISTAGTDQCETFPDNQALVMRPGSRLVERANGVSVSGGTHLTIRVEVTCTGGWC